MSKEYKIKRSKKSSSMLYKPRLHPAKVVLIVVLLIGLGYLGFVIYAPIRDALASWGEQPDTPPGPLPVTADSESEPELEEASSSPDAGSNNLKAVYLPHETVSSQSALIAFLDRLPEDINAVMVDIKDQAGNVLFTNKVESANAWGIITENAVSLPEVAQTLEEKGVSLIVRMSAFCDDTASRFDKDIAVQYRAPGVAWIDDFIENGGKRWLNPYHETARQYLIDLALAAVDDGAVMVVLSDFQFPPNSLTADAYFGEVGGVTRTQCLKTFADTMTQAVEEKGARMAVYLPAAALTEENATLYGGSAKDILPATVLLGALPYQFSENYDSGGLVIRDPLLSPADTVKQAVGYAQGVTDAKMLVLLQGGQETDGVAYTADQLAAQVAELSNLGVEEYILYCTDIDGYVFQ